MVYDKARSGDPDYDDKQPPSHHAGGVVVSAGDGVIIDPVTGPRDAEGAHVNLAVDTMDLDNRPTPGNVAEKPSEVQDYGPEDTPAFAETTDAEQADVDAIRESQASVRANAETEGVVDVKTQNADSDKDPATGGRVTGPTVGEDDTVPAKKTAAAKATAPAADKK